MTSTTKVKKFHQFVQEVTGPVNTALVDLLKGNVFQVDNGTIDCLKKGDYDQIVEFIEAAEEEKLLIDIDPQDWIPELPPLPQEMIMQDKAFELHIEAGISLDEVLEQANRIPGFKLSKIIYYGDELPAFPAHYRILEIVKGRKNFDECLKNSCIDGNFKIIRETFYIFNQKYNTCWGLNLAITADGKIRPCIYSETILGDFHQDTLNGVMERVKELWSLTKDNVETCRDCELRYTCFDCRELALRETGDLYASNPNCKYNPYEGTWRD